jgi:adenylate cyclase
LEINPECISAYYNLAWTYYNAYEQGWLSNADQPLRLGLSHVRRALALDRLDGFIQATMAYGLASSRDYSKAKTHYEMALELNPNHPMIYPFYGLFLAYIGKAEDAPEMFVRARTLDPQLNAFHFGMQGIVEYALKRYRQAIGSFERIDTTVNEIRAWHAASLAQLGQTEAAKELLGTYLRIAAQEMCEFPGDDPDVWQEHWLRAVPFQNSTDFDHLVEGLRKAGLRI